MSHACAYLQNLGDRSICGLLGTPGISTDEGQITALREIVEHFQIRWALKPHFNGDSEKGGFRKSETQ